MLLYSNNLEIKIQENDSTHDYKNSIHKENIYIDESLKQMFLKYRNGNNILNSNYDEIVLNEILLIAFLQHTNNIFKQKNVSDNDVIIFSKLVPKIRKIINSDYIKSNIPPSTLTLIKFIYIKYKLVLNNMNNNLNSSNFMFDKRLKKSSNLVLKFVHAKFNKSSLLYKKML